MGWIRLSDEDREKYGGPEKVPFSYGKWGLKSIDAMEQQVGWTVEDLGNAMRRPLLDDDGNPVLSEDDDKSPLINPRPAAIAVLAWLALRGVGVVHRWDDFDIGYPTLKLGSDDDEGKAPELAEA